MAAVLEAGGIDLDARAITADDLAAALRSAAANSVAHPSDSLSYLPLVVRELGLRAAEAYDLASEVPVDDVHLGPVAYFLVLADLILPIVWPPNRRRPPAPR